ncbi:MAG: SHOCT domain-containing protein [Polyangia bacterium]
MRFPFASFFLPIAIAVIAGCGSSRRSPAAPKHVAVAYPRAGENDTAVFDDLPVQLYFAPQSPPSGTEVLRPIRARGAAPADAGGCRRAGIEGLRRLQLIATRHRAEAVVNIRATWNGETACDDTTFTCTLARGRYQVVWEGALARLPEEAGSGEEEDSASRLRELQSLYYRGLITREEFLQRRRVVLDSL